MFPLILLIPIVLFFLHRNKTSKIASKTAIIRDLPLPDPYAGMNIDSVPPKPKVAGAIIDTPSWFIPKDDLTEQGIIDSKRLTVRQIQTVFNKLGAHLALNGDWDLPTTQATWDFQYIHQADNPQTLLNVTSEIDVLTQAAIQREFANKILNDLANNPDIHVPGSEAWKQYNAARQQNPWA
jgi:hypothetical protein